jgi:hypothetical protein
MIAAIQTHGELLHWHPHLHVLITCGAFTPDGDFLELPEFDMERLLVAWQDAVFELYLAEEKIEPEVVENMRTWQHSGFSVDQSVFLPAGDQAGAKKGSGTNCRNGPKGAAHNWYLTPFLHPSREASLPSLSRSERRRNASGSEAQFSDSAAARFPGRVHAAHSAEGFASDSLLWLVLEQVTRHAEEGGSCGIRSAIGRGDHPFSL